MFFNHTRRSNRHLFRRLIKPATKQSTTKLQFTAELCLRNSMEIKRITWEQALPIRHVVLWPDKELGFCKVEGDETAFHYGAYVNNNLVCVSSVYIDKENARLRKFATLKEHQGKGIGSKVIAHILRELKEKNMVHFWCDARKSAVGFYKRFGMTVGGDEFFKSGVPYFKMAIKLT